MHLERQNIMLLTAGILLSLISPSKGRCRSLTFTDGLKGKVLMNHTIRTIRPITDSDACISTCFLESRCFSINICKKSDGALSCNLLDSDQIRSKDSLAKRQDCTYYGTKSACSSSPCAKNATCEGDFENEPIPYRCVCPVGFTGQACQIDIDECMLQGACHVDAVCTNTRGGFNCSCKRGFVGDGKNCHVARSCKGIKDLGYSRGDGEYWIDPENTGQPFIVYCDMTTDSGGWTLIKQAKINSTSPRQYGVITSTNYRDISNWRDIRYVMKSPQLQELRLAMGFHQLRFRCFKNRPGRTIHIMTTNDTAGRKVLDHFLLDATWPTACTTFQKLPDDTSILSDHCNRWGDLGNLNHWGRKVNYGDLRIYNRPFYWANNHSIAFDPENTYLCDDDDNNKETGALTIGDIWELYCR